MSKSELFRDVYSDAKVQESEANSVDSIGGVITFIDGRMPQVSELIEAEDYERALPQLIDMYAFLCDKWNYPRIGEEWDVDDLWERLGWICFRICYCYCELEDYARAYYYIDIVRNVDSDCFMEWINVLVNSRRVDALMTVESCINDPASINDIFSDEVDQKKIMDFLERRLAYLYIEKREYAEARKLLEKLLSNPDSSEFAREELDYLDSL
ncbi:MAG: hypothetical protein K2J58_04055 [Muribaculaceae bacterium]|nr:hypothetical protein [Muribaculaceae bacterium]